MRQASIAERTSMDALKVAIDVRDQLCTLNLKLASMQRDLAEIWWKKRKKLKPK